MSQLQNIATATPAISLKDLTFSFTNAESPTLSRVNLDFAAGEFALICGPTGSGKSTLLKAINALVPHFTAGTLGGKIELFGEDYAGRKPHEFAPLVGFVNQQAESAFVADRVDEEIAFGMEQLGFENSEMVDRIKQTGASLGLSEIICDNLTELSGGQQQRVAIAAALAVGQRILLLDEPTSELDPDAAHKLLLELRDLSRTQGITVLIAEHRIERALDLVDSVTVVHGDGSVQKAMRADGLEPLLLDYRMVPPAVELAQKLGWSPLALNVSQARSQWQFSQGDSTTAAPQNFANRQVTPAPKVDDLSPVTKPLLTASELTVKYGQTPALDGVSFQLTSGSIIALMGPNGSGKSSLLWSLQGSQSHTGKVTVHSPNDSESFEPSSLKPLARLKHIALVPQTASDLLMHNSISDELADSDLVADATPGTSSSIFARLAGRIDPARHPRDLSHGQQLALTLAIQLSKGANIVLLDEPTRGLDYEAKRQLAKILTELKSEGRAVLFATHDVEFIALVADRVIKLDSAKITDEGSATQVLGKLGELAPQVWQVTEQFIRVEDAVQAVEQNSSGK